MGIIDCLDSIPGLACPSTIVFLLSSLGPGKFLSPLGFTSRGSVGLETVYALLFINPRAMFASRGGGFFTSASEPESRLDILPN